MAYISKNIEVTTEKDTDSKSAYNFEYFYHK